MKEIKEKTGKKQHLIVSASRRTDIPAFYSEWFMKRIEEGFVYVRNPRNRKQISRINLDPENVACIVFWTKNAGPMLKVLDDLDAAKFRYYFQYTVTPYGEDIEPGLIDKSGVIDAFKSLSSRIGKSRVIWRYDPVIFEGFHTIGYHTENFRKICGNLADYTEKCIFSFADVYRRMSRVGKSAVSAGMDMNSMKEAAAGFAEIAQGYGLTLCTCAEELDLSEYGILPAACIDGALIERLSGFDMKLKKDPNQRPQCLCVGSIDIGAYDCCPHGCVYCYAARGRELSTRNMAWHDPLSPLLIGSADGDEIIRERI